MRRSPYTASTVAAAAAQRLGEPRYVLAARCRVGPGEFGRIISGRQVPNADQADRIAELLGVTAEDLFGAASG